MKRLMISVPTAPGGSYHQELVWWLMAVQVQSFVEGVVASHTDGDELGDLLEGVDSVEQATRIVRSFETNVPRGRSQDEDEAERIRARVGRGKQRSLEEDTFGVRNKPGNGQQGAVLDDFGLSEDEFNELSGTGNLTS